MSNKQTGSVLNEFTFSARVVSFFSRSDRVAVFFSSTSDSGFDAKFDPRFFWVIQDNSGICLRKISIRNAWVTYFGLFLFINRTDRVGPKVLFVSASTPVFPLLRALLGRLSSHDPLEKLSLSSYFWRMNVLR